MIVETNMIIAFSFLQSVLRLRFEFIADQASQRNKINKRYLIIKM